MAANLNRTTATADRIAAGRAAAQARSEQRIKHLVNLDRALTEEESDELYRALHADYMRKWRQHRAQQMQREMGRFAAERSLEERKRLLAEMRRELWRLEAELEEEA